jgi:transposase-like protein
MDRDQLSCLNPNCSLYGKLGAGNISIHSNADKRYYCTLCKERFSARQGTIFYNLNTDEEKVLLALKLLAERNSLRATARILDTTKESVSRWLGRAAVHANEVSDYFLRELKISQAQIDELWSFVGKKRCRQKQARPGSRQRRCIYLALHLDRQSTESGEPSLQDTRHQRC